VERCCGSGVRRTQVGIDWGCQKTDTKQRKTHPNHIVPYPASYGKRTQKGRKNKWMGPLLSGKACPRADRDLFSKVSSFCQGEWCLAGYPGWSWPRSLVLWEASKSALKSTVWAEVTNSTPEHWRGRISKCEVGPVSHCWEIMVDDMYQRLQSWFQKREFQPI
jgi:hypothetical protein